MVDESQLFLLCCWGIRVNFSRNACPGTRRSLEVHFNNVTLYRMGLWAGPSETEGRQSTPCTLHKVFVNETGLKSTSPAVNYGSILVKENIGKDNQLKAVTVMYKVTGYNPVAGDWFWVNYGVDGKAAKSGKPAGCISCHSGASDSGYISDYLMIHSFDE